jgi:hypothetical protein
LSQLFANEDACEVVGTFHFGHFAQVAVQHELDAFLITLGRYRRHGMLHDGEIRFYRRVAVVGISAGEQQPDSRVFFAIGFQQSSDALAQFGGGNRHFEAQQPGGTVESFGVIVKKHRHALPYQEVVENAVAAQQPQIIEPKRSRIFLPQPAVDIVVADHQSS